MAPTRIENWKEPTSMPTVDKALSWAERGLAPSSGLNALHIRFAEWARARPAITELTSRVNGIGSRGGRARVLSGIKKSLCQGGGGDDSQGSQRFHDTTRLWARAKAYPLVVNGFAVVSSPAFYT